MYYISSSQFNCANLCLSPCLLCPLGSSPTFLAYCKFRSPDLTELCFDKLSQNSCNSGDCFCLPTSSFDFSSGDEKQVHPQEKKANNCLYEGMQIRTHYQTEKQKSLPGKCFTGLEEKTLKYKTKNKYLFRAYMEVMVVANWIKALGIQSLTHVV